MEFIFGKSLIFFIDKRILRPRKAQNPSGDVAPKSASIEQGDAGAGQGTPTAGDVREKDHRGHQEDGENGPDGEME